MAEENEEGDEVGIEEGEQLMLKKLEELKERAKNLPLERAQDLSSVEMLAHVNFLNETGVDIVGWFENIIRFFQGDVDDEDEDESQTEH